VITDRTALPAGLRELALAASTRLRDEFGSAHVFQRCLANCWTTTLRHDADDSAFVITGDIPAMWLRDTAAQVRPYLGAARDATVAGVLAAVSRRMVTAVLTDPYANAFNDGPTGALADPHDRPAPSPAVWERKYEVDSLAAVLSFGYDLWRVTGSAAHLDARFAAAAAAVIWLWRVEQDHEAASPYRFERLDGPFRYDTLPRGGLGSPVGRTGMTWSGFRPSDDRCEYGYLVPANAAAVVALNGLVHLAAAGLLPEPTGRAALDLAVDIATGIHRFGTVEGPAGRVYAYEVDGLGHANLMDDANTPSLLALPTIGWCGRDDPLYRRTRQFVLSTANPYFFRGTRVAGIGSPHTPDRYVWPIALCVQALSAVSRAETAALYRTLLDIDGGTGLMHESVHVDEPRQFTRPWFAWANSMFAEVGLELAGMPVPRPHPPVPEPVALAVAEP
jgi:meiotically up-regulated gene 157 (Mug157) protein